MPKAAIETHRANGYSNPTAQEPRKMIRSTASMVSASLAADGAMLLVAAVAAVLFSRTLATAVASETLQRLIAPSPWLMVATLLLVPLGCLILDVLSAAGNRLRLPFAGSQKRARRIYAGRVHLMLLAFYFNAILLALCWSAAAMPLVSKLFLAAVFAIAIYALGQSVPSTSLSFFLSGALFVIVLVATQAFIIFKMQAEAESNAEQLREQFELQNAPEEE